MLIIQYESNDNNQYDFMNQNNILPEKVNLTRCKVLEYYRCTALQDLFFVIRAFFAYFSA